MLAWVLLVIAGLLEIVWAAMLKQHGSSTRVWPWVATLGAMIASFALLSAAMRSLPLGVAYTVWVGIGAVGSVVVGVALLGEKLSPVQAGCLLLIVLGIVGLKLSTPTKPASATPPASTPASSAPTNTSGGAKP